MLGIWGRVFSLILLCSTIVATLWQCWSKTDFSFPAVSNGFSKITTHQKKMVYLCQLLIRIADGKRLGKYCSLLVLFFSPPISCWSRFVVCVCIYVERGVLGFCTASAICIKWLNLLYMLDRYYYCVVLEWLHVVQVVGHLFSIVSMTEI